MSPAPNFKKKRVKLSREDYDHQREQIFERQDFICKGCGRRRPLTRDHIRKRSQLGGDELSNAQGLCFDCHDKKDNRLK